MQKTEIRYSLFDIEASHGLLHGILWVQVSCTEKETTGHTHALCRIEPNRHSEHQCPPQQPWCQAAGIFEKVHKHRIQTAVKDQSWNKSSFKQAPVDLCSSLDLSALTRRLAWSTQPPIAESFISNGELKAKKRTHFTCPILKSAATPRSLGRWVFLVEECLDLGREENLAEPSRRTTSRRLRGWNNGTSKTRHHNDHKHDVFVAAAPTAAVRIPLRPHSPGVRGLDLHPRRSRACRATSTSAMRSTTSVLRFTVALRPRISAQRSGTSFPLSCTVRSLSAFALPASALVPLLLLGQEPGVWPVCIPVGNADATEVDSHHFVKRSVLTTVLQAHVSSCP